MKYCEDGTIRLKARTVIHGNRDNGQYSVHRDSASADLSVVRLVLSLEVILGLCFGTAGVKGAYMQSGPIKRDIYVRPPKEFYKMGDQDCRRKPHGGFWKLIKLPYGIFEAGRQWLCSIETRMLNTYEMERVQGMEKLFVKREKDGKVCLLVAKLVDEFLVISPPKVIDRFFQSLHKYFTLGVTNKGIDMKFLVFKMIIGSDGSVDVIMQDYLDRVKPLQLSRSIRHKIH